MMPLRLLCYFLLVTIYLVHATGGLPAPVVRIAATPDGRNRKMTADMSGLAKEDLLMKHGSLLRGGEKSTRWKLREIPLGPNPMHHHGNGPQKKPQNP